MTDASFCDKIGACGYAFWIASDRGKRGGSGIISCKVSSSNEGEMMAICNALHMAMRLQLVHPGDEILFQTDSIYAIDRFGGMKPCVGGKQKKAVSLVVKYAANNDFKIRFRHVKAHSGVCDKRSFSNEFCDAKAKQRLREARKNFYRKGVYSC